MDYANEGAATGVILDFKTRTPIVGVPDTSADTGDQTQVCQVPPARRINSLLLGIILLPAIMLVMDVVRRLFAD
jgi:hypothetical protein